jgi:phospholipid-transporting ATPase
VSDQKNSPNAAAISDFLTLLAVCHTVIPEKSTTDPSGITYQSASPDETALVEGVKSLGYFFKDRKPKSVVVNVNNVDYTYEILAVNEFNSTRKRMSLICRLPTGKIKLFVKGADTVIYERLARGDPNADITSKHLEEYATIGLRTLCLASRDISQQDFDSWKVIFDQAATTIDNRQQKLDDAAELIEKDLNLLGATAIEDKLQEGVPETIQILMEAGIKMWVLTGDRQETAINIGYSCKLITPSMQVLICNKPTLEATRLNLESSLRQALKGLQSSEPYIEMGFYRRLMRNVKRSDLGKFSKNYGADAKPMVLVIDGKTLTHALDPSVSKTFLQLALLCKAVVCCRVSPLQKALVVRLVKENVAQSVTLAIGDGANDVTMIQAAHLSTCGS